MFTNKKLLKEINKNKIIIFSILLVVILGIIIFFNSKLYTKIKYNKALEKKDCEAVYKLLNIYDNEYFSYENFINQCKINIETYSDDEIKFIGKKIENNIVKYYENIEIKYPSDSTLLIDNKQTSNLEYSLDEDEIYKIVKVNLYEGEYTLNISNNISQTSKDINITGENIIMEYNNEPAKIIVLSNKNCRFCTNLEKYLNTLDKNILSVKYYEILESKNKNLITKMKKIFNYKVIGTPVIIIGDKYFAGYDDSLDKEYKQLIYEAYRNKLKNALG